VTPEQPELAEGCDQVTCAVLVLHRTLLWTLGGTDRVMANAASADCALPPNGNHVAIAIITNSVRVEQDVPGNLFRRSMHAPSAGPPNHSMN